MTASPARGAVGGDGDALPVVLVTAGKLRLAVPAAEIASLEKPSGTAPALAAALGGVSGTPAGPILCDHAGRRWQVDAVHDLEPLPLAAIHRVPPLLLGRTSQAVWGMAVQGEQPIVLLLSLAHLPGPPATPPPLDEEGGAC
jgi:hypothetical protein